ncbi:MAG: efflux RND transporter periplasmic adaptor subunit [Terriglobia bacterium]
MSDSKSKPPKRKPGGWGLYFLSLIAVVLGVYLIHRLRTGENRDLAAELRQMKATAQAGPRVQVITVEAGPASRQVQLLGETYPYFETILYAKVSGYLKQIRVDKGDKVTANEVVAVISSPETDSQYRAAVADDINKRVTANRAVNLVKRDMIAKQDADLAVTNARMADDNVANLATLRSYEIIRAPFAGTVTARYADPGALVQNATNAQTSALPVVRIAETGVLRVYVYPDQGDAELIHVGDRAEVVDATRLEVKVAARVTRISGQLDTATRTMLTEIDINNQAGRFLPGSFVNVTLNLRNSRRGIEIPSEGLILRNNKPFVAVVTPDDRVTFRPVSLISDDGAMIHIRSGLKRGERIALNIGDLVEQGGKIQPVAVAQNP